MTNKINVASATLPGLHKGLCAREVGLWHPRAEEPAGLRGSPHERRSLRAQTGVKAVHGKGVLSQVCVCYISKGGLFQRHLSVCLSLSLSQVFL